MGSGTHGAERASRRTLVGPSFIHVAERHRDRSVVTRTASIEPPPDRPPDSSRPSRPLSGIRVSRRWLAAIVLTSIALGGTLGASAPAIAATGGELLMPHSELMALPTTGTAWTGLKAVADAALPAPNLCDQSNNHHLRTFAAALVYARTGIASYGAKARAAVMAALPTQVVGCDNATLALGRQLTAYVLAADLAGLSGSDETTFRSWLSAIRTKFIGGHPSRTTLQNTDTSAPNNWGAYAGAGRIAADLYLDDTADLAAAARVTRGFLGDRSAYAGFTTTLTSAAVSWTCTGSVSTYTALNAACTKSGINIDGGIGADISRGGPLRWPPLDPGIPYQLESIQGLGLQLELLSRHGYPDAWSWSNSALKRAAAIVTRSGAAGGTGWNLTTASRQMPWLLNLRYGTSIPTRTAGMGRAIGFTDWLYGSGAAPSSAGGGGGGGGGGTPAPTPTPTPKPPSNPPAGTAPTTTKPTVKAIAAPVPTSGVPATVRWSLATSSAGLRRFDLQVNVDGRGYTGLGLSSATATGRRVTLAAGHRYAFRVRAVDRAGRVGSWSTVGATRGVTVGDGSPTLTYRGSWGSAAATSYLGHRVHFTRSGSASVTIRFSGSSIALIGPIGPTRGRSKVYVDGRYAATIDQGAAHFSARRMLFVRNLSSGGHTLVVRAVGTSGRPMVAIDAVEVLQRS